MIVVRIIAVALATLTASTGIAATVAAPLLPLSDADEQRIMDYGCESSFTNSANQAFFFVKNNQMIVRIARGPAGLTICTPPSNALDAFTNGGGSVRCGDATVTLRQTGKATGYAEADGMDFPATLTTRRAGRVWTARGRAGTAC